MNTLYRIVNPREVFDTVVIEIVKNIFMSIPIIQKIRTRLGRTARPPDKLQLKRYVYQLYEAVQRYAGGVEGKSVLKIGPGDNLVTGLAFLAAGATSYTVIDRFPGQYYSTTARSWYKLLSNNWPYGKWPQYLDPERFPDYENVFIKGGSVEDARSIGTYDIVCSNVVGEHVSDIQAFANLNINSIAQHGIALHNIDFGGHQWDRFGDPFLFMKFNNLLWKLMGSARGVPQRVRFNQYKKIFENAGLVVEVPVRKICKFNPSDEWVRVRADESFLTTYATFLLKAKGLNAV